MNNCDFFDAVYNMMIDEQMGLHHDYSYIISYLFSGCNVPVCDFVSDVEC